MFFGCNYNNLFYVHVCVCVCVCVCMYVCVYIHIYVYMCISMYVGDMVWLIDLSSPPLHTLPLYVVLSSHSFVSHP